MSISIMRDGKLWGLFACHHYSPRHISFERAPPPNCSARCSRWILESREREAMSPMRARAHQVQDRLMEAAASARTQPARAIADFIGDFRKMIACDGVAVWSDGEITLSGETPTEAR